MKLIKHTKYIYEYQNFVPENICDEIVSLVESSDISSEIWNNSRNQYRNNSKINLTGFINHVDRNRHAIDQNSFHNVRNADAMAHEIFTKANFQYLKDCPSLSFVMMRQNIQNFGSYYVYRTYDEKDYYDWHVDYDENEENLLSYLWYLNDDFSGGKLMFLNDKFSIQPKKGSLICFPVGHWWVHKSSPLKSGKKKVVWTCFFKQKG
jgi:hypothetical protein